MIELDYDNEKWEQYHMQYNDLLHYMDEGHRSYSRYNLSSDPMACPTANNESVRVRGNIFWHNSDSDSDSDGTSYEEPEGKSPEEEEKSYEDEEEGGQHNLHKDRCKILEVHEKWKSWEER